MKKICKICEKEFNTKSSKRVICYDEHYHPCPICGTSVLTIDLQHLNSCCSTKCSRIKAAQTTRDNFDIHPAATTEAVQRRKQTNLIRYGSENVMDNQEIRNRSRQHASATYQTNHAEIQQRRESTCLERYGTSHPMQNSEIKYKVKSTNLDRYGCECTLQCPQVQNESRCTMIEKYGVENALNSDEIRNKIKQTNLQRYGTEHAIQSDIVRDKAKATMVEKYGVEHARQDDEINNRGTQTYLSHLEDEVFASELKQKREESFNSRYGGVGFASHTLHQKARFTMQEKYGVPYYSQSSDWKEKSEATSSVRYGVPNPAQSEEVKAKISQSMMRNYGVPSPSYLNMKDSTKLPQLLQFKDDPRSFILSLREDLRTEPGIAEAVGVTPSAISAYVISHNLYDLVTVSKSGMEDCICEFLDELKVRYIRNTRNVIAPLELDIYLPETKTAIECNPTVTHNSSFPDPWGGSPKTYTYHKDKSIRCRDNGVFLFHIFGYEWTNHSEVIKSMLRNLTGSNTAKVYARKTVVRELSSSECMKFLNENHRQGATNASIRLGLIYKDELVSVMTFNKVRKTIGMNDDSEGVIELSRFCNKLNTSVLGGASKLFSYFLNNYTGKKVISFSDIAHTRGNLYAMLGFTPVSESSPGYTWVNLSDDSYYNRVSCQKRNLRSLFKDESIDIDNHTEREIMMEHGYGQVFDSGVIRWELNRC